MPASGHTFIYAAGKLETDVEFHSDQIIIHSEDRGKQAIDCKSYSFEEYKTCLCKHQYLAVPSGKLK